MKKYKVIKPFFKLSEQKNYNIGDDIELNSEDANSIIDYLDNINNKTSYEKSKEGTKGIVYKKTIEEADAEIKQANSKINE